eukprot:6077356-Amphidinium_carterae.1
MGRLAGAADAASGSTVTPTPVNRDRARGEARRPSTGVGVPLQGLMAGGQTAAHALWNNSKPQTQYAQR